MTSTPVKVLSIVGPGRSGSTIVASILGEAPGVVSAGEVRWLWRRGVVDERPCGCGEPPTRCPVWAQVLDRTFEGRCGPGVSRSTALGEVLDAQHQVSARRNRLRVLHSASSRHTTWPAMAVMRAVSSDATAALAAAAGADLVVDTSKRAQEAAIFAGSPGVDHFVLHLVRDPRAVAFSWGRTRAATPSPGARPMGNRTPTSSAARWVENAVGAELLRRRIPADRWMSLRYEDFVAAPESTIGSILGFVGHHSRPRFLAPDALVLGDNHIVAGNPSRFRTGQVQIRDDDEWRRRLPGRDRRRVELITSALLGRYGYSAGATGAVDPVRPGHDPARGA